MTTWILILFLHSDQGSAVSAVTAEFYNKSKCETAGKAANYSVGTYYICVEK